MSRYWPIDSFQGINEQYLKQRILYILSEIVNSQSISFNTPNETWEEAMNKIETKLFLHFLSKIFLQFKTNKQNCTCISCQRFSCSLKQTNKTVPAFLVKDFLAV